MKTTLDKATREELVRRIGTLQEQSAALWGKMNVYQMVAHCAQWDEMAFGRRQYKRSFIGRLFGKMALKSMIKDETPVNHNMPTVPGFVVTGNGDVATAKAKWITLIEEYGKWGKPGFTHPFFGYMTREQTGYMAYKHADHHLKQFNA